MQPPPPTATTWTVVGASVAGTSHAEHAQPCQDAHAYATLPAVGGVALAVSDGAGSVSHAEAGARLAADTAVETARRLLAVPPVDRTEDAWRALLKSILEQARDAVVEAARAAGLPPREFSATLILAIVTGDTIAAAQIGDGACVVATEAGETLSLTGPVIAEYLNETTFLVSPNGIDSARFSVWSGAPAGVALLSDGFQGLALKLPSGIAHGGFFRPLLDFARNGGTTEGLTEWMNSPKVTAKTDDDLTLLLAVPAA